MVKKVLALTCGMNRSGSARAGIDEQKLLETSHYLSLLTSQGGSVIHPRFNAHLASVRQVMRRPVLVC